MALPHYQFQMYHPFLSFSNPDNSLFVKIVDGLPAEPGNIDNDALHRMASDAYKRLPPMKSKSDFNKELSNYHDELDGLRMGLEEMKEMTLRGTILLNSTEMEVNFKTAEDDLILTMAWSIYREDRDLNPWPSVKMEQWFIKWFSFLALINIDLAFRATAFRVEGAIDATIQASFAIWNVLTIESSNEMLQEEQQNLASQGSLARH
ncbi:hypothetical protein SAMN05216299_1339 [Nitrosospira sp. Nsp14]|uniref:hypothetical protein n=1 Tax=Nitrosospira sp. Nsp14 TaxID=1855333 RepID=UPI0008EC3EED|nr:hypothetical protein [Nitrosospira sp. Nsp14]SFH60706.1 hypothetical protein SAMN05216299_1339 [Nitrosospira sp. Nsp14]